MFLLIIFDWTILRIVRVLLHKLSHIGLLKGGDALMVNRKRFVVYEAILMSFGGILWGSICLIIDKPTQSITPFGYVYLSTLNTYTFSQLGIGTTFHIELPKKNPIENTIV